VAENPAKLKIRNIHDMTRSDFEQLPHRDWDEDIGQFDCLIILPTKHKHDSEFACMDFVACDGDRPICRLSGCSDVVHINGIGGFGKDWTKKFGGVPTAIPPVDWSIDCLFKSKLLRLFTHQYKLVVDPALSSFCVYAVPKKKEGQCQSTKSATVPAKNQSTGS
jgi:hypothetical protein